MSCLLRLPRQEPAAWLLVRHLQVEAHFYWDQAITYQILPEQPAFEKLIPLIMKQDLSWV
jgi:hypothetical protein